MSPVDPPKPSPDAPTPWMSEMDLYLFGDGSHVRLHDKMGAHPATDAAGNAGVHFAVWAPQASAVSVVGEWNGWRRAANRMRRVGDIGVWEAFVPGVGVGTRYKFHVVSTNKPHRGDKSDPFAFHAEEPPRTGSVVADLSYDWGDGAWMASRKAKMALDAPMAIYELHVGSWKRRGDGKHLGYRELARELPTYVRESGFTHVELMPVMEHPYYASWGYQVTGYFAATSRYGTPQDLMHLVDALHQQGIGVILDWVPSHFPTDGHGLGFFDGTHLYEHADPRQGFHPDWKSFIFNYGRPEVRSFLLSSALFWLDRYHADALRVDAVASMLYLDYSRKEGEWIANVHGGKENLEAIAFLKRLNEEVYKHHPDVQCIAEESTSWPLVSRPVYIGGLGFGLKWDMGWMHDTLKYMAMDGIFRKFNHHHLTFRGLYAFHENFVLSLSHDEVVHGKGSLLNKMAGRGMDKFANLRLMLAHMWALPGKKLLFMGGELGQWKEWDHDGELSWELLDYPPHRGVRSFVQALNRMYVSEPALHEIDFAQEGFSWIDCGDSEQSVISFLRMGRRPGDTVLAVFNFTPVARFGYRIGVPWDGHWHEVLNSDALEFAGGGLGNLGGVEAEPEPKHGRPRSIVLTLPGLSALFFKAPTPPAPDLSTNSTNASAIPETNMELVAWHERFPHAGDPPPPDDSSSRD